MNVEIKCPYGTLQGAPLLDTPEKLIRCGATLKCLIDTEGDRDVGLEPMGLENVAGTCIHADGINNDLENEGPERIKVLWPTFSGELNDKLDSIYQEQMSYYSHDDEEADDDSARS